ncbi:hypothetical protein NA57DRAFT_50406 [Rhizodiscina lignyota]|uniref:Methyltransferase type 11 domain-containing protein n=1 Tax=Rhizodiscina lignyota TaxID=1504668 RepID=A0A9P4I3B1_9PEZI|nr:hypothetical protein NA57DRAFT_50406 [Rhizodiscina lignyota]
MKAVRPQRPSLGAPFQYPTIAPPTLQGNRQLPPLPLHPSQYRRPSNATVSSGGHDSTGGRFLPSLPGPNSPYSISEFLSAYGDRSLSMATIGTTNNRMSNAESEDKGDAGALVDEDTGLESMANLRFGALMTSKWLSFGRVLFSPAHFELKDPKEDRVLIIDGLGKDWSYYVALTYPQAAVYSLGPDPSAFPSTSPSASNGPFQSMPNHRHIHHPMLTAPFPFPKGFFAAVIFRFPAVGPESAYRTALSECKRVLRPGGYLEISVLDMDLVNMGNCARKAVRGLKMKMAERNPELCLRPVSDVLMKLLGRRGFEGMQRCIVGVPAAGPVRNSSDMDGAPQGEVQPKTAFSFTQLMSDQDNVADSSNITRMVARVGRWWYERCYESSILAADNTVGAPASSTTSIWRDQALLNECEKRGTTFRLLICYAQKPTVAVRRTVSV